MLKCVGADELTDWQQYERLYGPVGPERGDLQAAIVACVIANANRGKSTKTFKPADFMPKFRGDTPGARTPDEMRSKLMALTKHFGGKIEGPV